MDPCVVTWHRIELVTAVVAWSWHFSPSPGSYTLSTTTTPSAVLPEPRRGWCKCRLYGWAFDWHLFAAVYAAMSFCVHQSSLVTQAPLRGLSTIFLLLMVKEVEGSLWGAIQPRGDKYKTKWMNHPTWMRMVTRQMVGNTTWTSKSTGFPLSLGLPMIVRIPLGEDTKSLK